MDRGSDIAGAWMARLIADHPEVDPRPLAAEAYCLWAEELSTKRMWPNQGWPDTCEEITADMTEKERAQAELLAQELLSAP